MRVNGFVDGLESEVVSSAVDHAAFNAPAGKQHCEAKGVMIATGTAGLRPNSVPTTTSVSLKSPRSFKSSTSEAIAGSACRASR